MVKVNGKMLDAAGKSVRELLEMEGYSLSRTAVELNGELVVRADYDKQKLSDGDVVEIVGFVGGG